eukprot:169694-Amphidinium_carterae.1
MEPSLHRFGPLSFLLLHQPFHSDAIDCDELLTLRPVRDIDVVYDNTQHLQLRNGLERGLTICTRALSPMPAVSLA